MKQLKYSSLRLIKSFISFSLAFVMCFSSVFAYEFAQIKQESDAAVLEIEAEDFVGSGFKTVEDSSASGGKCIVGEGDGSKSVEYTLTLEDNAKMFVIYAVHKAETVNANLSYIKINHFENYSLYDYEVGKWNKTRLFYGEVEKGEYKIKLTNIRKGQKIDKLIIKYEPQKGDDGGVKFATNAIDNSKEYIPGKAENEKLNIAEAEERVPGSWLFEVEDGICSDKVRVGEDESCSGGKYFYAPTDEKLPHITEWDLTEEFSSRFKFNVTHKGSYKLWIRYSTPVSNQKSTWFAIDGNRPTRIDDSSIKGWVWKNLNTHYLDTGWHTLDIKYRQPGHKVDCVILTDVSGFTAKGQGSLPGEPVIFDSSSWDIIAKSASKPKMKTNNYRNMADCNYVMGKKDILVPATNLFNTCAIDYEMFDDSVVATKDRKYLKVYMDSERVIINGKALNSGTKAYKFEGAIPLIPISAAKKAFGIDYEYNKDENTLNVFYDFEENYREAKEGEIIATPGERFFSYEIPCDDPTAKCEVWYRFGVTDTWLLGSQNYDNMNTIKDGGIEYKSNGTRDWKYWKKCIPPVYSNGAFRGSELDNYVERTDIKVKLVKNGKEDVFVKYNALVPLNNVYTKDLTVEEFAPDTNGGILLIPTFENIGYYVDSEDSSGCSVTYRKKGEETVKKAYAPVYDDVSKQYRGSIVGLEENTEYEVTAKIGGKEVSAEIKTKNSDVPVAKTIGLSEIYRGKGGLLLQDIQGSEDGWIKITADEKMNTVDAGNVVYEAVLISNCKYLIFEGIKVRGGYCHGINIHGKSEYINIINCDIAEWGNEGILNEDFGGFAFEGAYRNNFGGIFFYDVGNILIERNYIHDSNVKTNAWDTDTYRDVHPKGGTGIQMLGTGGVVIRYNDVIGSDEHRFNDVMEGTNNSGRSTGSLSRDSDVYGNMMIYSEDDSIELDGGQRNVRVYANRMEQSRCGISTAPNMMGPTYLFNNLIVNLGGTYNNASGSAIKAGGNGGGDFFGHIFMFCNTMDSEGTGPANITYSGSSEYHSTTRNNIFVTRKDNKSPFKSLKADERDSNDYDLIAGGIAPTYKEGDEAHGVFAFPSYIDLDGGNYHLKDDSAGAGKGEYLDNFAESEAPDMGAYSTERNGRKNMPYRPVDMYTERPFEQAKDKEEREITIHVGDIGEGHSYSLVKNRDFGWMEIISDNGLENVPLSPNTTVKFKVKGDLSKCKAEQGKGLVLFRLENGFSVPITFWCVK